MRPLRPHSFRLIRIFVTILVIMLSAGQTAMAETWLYPLPEIVAGGAVLIDADTGQVLFGQAEHEQFFPASTTKIMTALLALEQGDPNALTTVSRTATDVEGSLAYITPGERISLRDLLHGLMLVSGNDAAAAIAEMISGSEADFADAMNTRAAALGMTDTHFVNAHGLHDPDHYTTPLDLARLTRHALANPAFAALAATGEYETEADPDRQYVNTNRLLWTMDGVTGVKTGYTPEANSAYVASAERDGRRLIAVVMNTGSEEKWTDAASLLEYGFAAFMPWPAVTRGKPAGSAVIAGGTEPNVPAMPTRTVSVLVGRDGAEPGPFVLSPADVEINPVFADELAAPLEAGDAIGTVVVTAHGTELSETELVAAVSVPAAAVVTTNPRWTETKQSISDWPVWEFVRLWWYVPLIVIAVARMFTTARRRRRARRVLQRQSAAGALPMHRLFRND